MTRADALRLKEGAEIIFGDHSHGAKVSHLKLGTVKFVTPAGGIKVSARNYNFPHEDIGDRWVPYHHVQQVVP